MAFKWLLYGQKLMPLGQGVLAFLVSTVGTYRTNFQLYSDYAHFLSKQSGQARISTLQNVLAPEISLLN